MWARWRWTAVLVGIAAAGTSECAAAEPQFVGFVTSIEREPGARNAKVTAESHAHKMVRRVVLTVTAETVIVKREGDLEKTARLDSLAVKSWIKVWFSGPSRDSRPVEATAGRIEIVDRP
jgi:hypothetical protein